MIKQVHPFYTPITDPHKIFFRTPLQWYDVYRTCYTRINKHSWKTASHKVISHKASDGEVGLHTMHKKPSPQINTLSGGTSSFYRTSLSASQINCICMSANRSPNTMPLFSHTFPHHALHAQITKLRFLFIRPIDRTFCWKTLRFSHHISISYTEKKDAVL